MGDGRGRLSKKHLSDLVASIKRVGWRIDAKETGNKYDISETWRISRVWDGKALCLHFDGLDGLNTLPIEKAYGFSIDEHPDIHIYFARQSRSWPNEHAAFEIFLKCQA